MCDGMVFVMANRDENPTSSLPVAWTQTSRLSRNMPLLSATVKTSVIESTVPFGDVTFPLQVKAVP